MLKKKGKFSTVIFSLIPGAGQMYMGFMKLGTSIMGLFAFIVLMAAWLDLSPLLIILPVLWFYSFFDSINKSFLSNEEFESLEDHYLFTSNEFVNLKKEFKGKLSLLFGVLLLIIGCYSIWVFFFNLVSNIPGLSNGYLDKIADIANNAPQLIFGVAIVVAGIWLIRGKKKELDKNA